MAIATILSKDSPPPRYATVLSLAEVFDTLDASAGVEDAAAASGAGRVTLASWGVASGPRSAANSQLDKPFSGAESCGKEKEGCVS